MKKHQQAKRVSGVERRQRNLVAFVIFIIMIALFVLALVRYGVISNFDTIDFLNNFKTTLDKKQPVPTDIDKVEVPAVVDKFFVARVLDGDTIELSDGRRVRYLGIDTPEMNYGSEQPDCYAWEATQKNQELVLNKWVKMQTSEASPDTDKYGRFLRFIYVDEELVNAYLLEQGFARTLSFDLDDRYKRQFEQLEKEAEQNKCGLWEVCQ